jgi:hypothetical protein
MSKEIWPIVVQSGDLGVVSTEGRLNPTIEVPSNIYPLALKEGTSSSNNIEYLYIRFSDGKLVASSYEPDTNAGKVVAIAETDTDSIVRITSTEPSFELEPEVKVLALCDTVYNRQVATQGWVRNEIGKYIDKNTLFPQLLSYDGLYDNQLATTEWVRSEIIKFLGYTFTVIIDTPSSLFWNEGEVIINNQPYIVPQGTHSFDLSYNGTYYIYVTLDSNTVSVEITSDPEPSFVGTRIGTLVINLGVIHSYQTHPKEVQSPPVIPLGDCSSTNMTTEWMINTWFRMAFGIESPLISVSDYKTILHWNNGRVRYQAYSQLINSGSANVVTLADGVYKLVSRLNETNLFLVSNKQYNEIELASIIIENQQLKSIYPII